MKLTVSECHIFSRTGDNKRPWSGWVTFSDGKHYTWGFFPEWDGQPEHMSFSSSRRLFPDQPYFQRYRFQSAKREEALRAWLEEHG